MKRITLALLAGALTFGGILATVSPASAGTGPIPDPIGGTVSLNVGDVRYGADGDCKNAPVNVSVQTPDDYAYLSYDFTSNYEGPTSWPVEVSGTGDYSGTFTDSFLVCPAFDSPGAYWGRLNVTFYDYDYNVITEAQASDSFHVLPRLHSSAVSAYHTHAGRHGWALKASARLDGHAWRNKMVSLQRYAGNGHWSTLRNLRTNSTGHATFAFTPATRALRGYRVLLPRTSSTAAHATSTHWLRRR